MQALLAAAVGLAPFQALKSARVLDGITGKSLVVVLPQLGEFDSAEYCEQLVAVTDDLRDANIGLRVVGIGDDGAATKFCGFTGLPPDVLRTDSGELHRELGLHAGPGWSVPEFVSDDALRLMLGTLPGGAPVDGLTEASTSALLRKVGDAWLNYLAMCAGLGAPGTLQEIFRGYVGDRTSPERLPSDTVVTAGPITIGPGVGPVKMGPIQYQQWWADERGSLRPVELATVRLKNMVEVLSNWDEYVTDPTAIALRGATYLFDEDGETLYEYRSRGVLTYSETMARPLSFLAPYIGEEKARNPLGLPDTGEATAAARGRGVLKPAGRAMGLLAPVFRALNPVQASALGVDDDALAAARAEIDRAVGANHVVIYTYGLSPFSTETIALLDEAGVDYERIEIGPEWVLLGKEGSATRAALLEMTGQSSLPHVFIDGQHVGGLFTGSPSSGGAGLASLKESRESIFVSSPMAKMASR